MTTLRSRYGFDTLEPGDWRDFAYDSQEQMLKIKRAAVSYYRNRDWHFSTNTKLNKGFIRVKRNW